MDNSLNLLKKLNIKQDIPLIVSVSGGVDSIVLLNLLVKSNYNVIVVHFNHHTRAQNLAEQDLVIDYANKFNLKYYVFNYEHLNTNNFQSDARNFRLSKLKATAKIEHTKYILTAHHLDDLAETVLMRITRGSNLYGYAGIHDFVKSDDFVLLKPLIYYSKQEIVSYALINDLKYLTDESNYESTYTRNRFRNTIIPIMKQENPNLLKQFVNYQQLLTNSFNFIRSYAKKFIKDGAINVKELLNEDLIIKHEVLVILLEHHNININTNLLNDLTKIITSSTSNLNYNLSNHKIFIKSYDTAYITENTVPASLNLILKEGENVISNMKKITLLTNVSNNDKMSINICYNKLNFPLIARTRKNGDKLKFAYGTKKLKDYLIDLKIPLHLRDSLLIITDSDNTILWVEGIYINKTLGLENKITLKYGRV